MKTHLILLLPCLALASPQNNGGGFFSGLTNAVNSFFGGPRRPQTPRPQFARPPPQQQQFQQPAQQQFQPQPPRQQFAPQPPRQQFQPQPTFQQTQSFQPQPQPSFSRPAAPAPSFSPQGSFSPQSSFDSQPSFNSQPSFSSQQTFQRQTFPSSSSSSSSPSQVSPYTVNDCSGPVQPNHFWNGVGFVATWKNGCSKFTQGEAKEYCNKMNMEPVSLDSPAKQDEFNRLIAQDAQRYFWTGGVVDHLNKEVRWNNVNGKRVKFSESAHWSNTGGAGLPQPDNRAAGENPPHPEVCLGILNNFYADGIKWHDVACHHRKPTVCEPRS